jgi:outer membrane protein assembly factor BamB
MSKIAIPTPFAGHGLLYLSSGYILDAARPLFAVRPGAAGDISLKGDETSNAFIAWSQKVGGPYNPSPVLYGDFLYVLYDRGLLSCFDARTGKLIYDKQRLDNATAFTASPWAYEGKVFCLSEEGETLVIQAGPEFKLLGKNDLAEMCLATPAIADHGLFIRTMGKLYRIQQGAGSGAK